MTKFEIGTCYMNEPSTMDAEQVARTVAKYVDQEEGSARSNGGALFALRSSEVFFGTRRAWTNVNFTVKLESFAIAQSLVAELIRVTGHGWNAPTQDPDAVAEAGPTWGMFTADGASRVAGAVALLEESLRNGTLPAQSLAAAVDAHMAAISNEGHREVYDTEVRNAIYSSLERTLEELGIRLTLNV